MKKLVLMSVFSFMFFIVSAQVEKGSMVLSGRIGAYFENMAGKTSSFTIMPEFSYYFTEKLGAGLGVGYTYGKLPENFKINRLEINPFIRYYFYKNNKLGIYGRGNLLLAVENSRNSSNTVLGFGITPGIQYFINKKISVELNFMDILNYSYFTSPKAHSFSFIGNPMGVNLGTLSLTFNFHIK